MNLLTATTNINTNLQNVDNSKAKLANALFDARKEVFWKETPYKYFKTFCEKEVALSHSAIFIYLKTAELSKKAKFSVQDMQLITVAIGWNRLRIGLTKLTTYVTPAEFIELYKNLNLNDRVVYEDKNTRLVNFNFNIPKEYADILTEELLVRGMRISNKSRTNMSAAVVSLIKELEAAE